MFIYWANSANTARPEEWGCQGRKPKGNSSRDLGCPQALPAVDPGMRWTKSPGSPTAGVAGSWCLPGVLVPRGPCAGFAVALLVSSAAGVIDQPAAVAISRTLPRP